MKKKFIITIIIFIITIIFINNNIINNSAFNSNLKYDQCLNKITKHNNLSNNYLYVLDKNNSFNITYFNNKNNINNILFNISVYTDINNPPKIIYDNNDVYILFDGIQYEENDNLLTYDEYQNYCTKGIYSKAAPKIYHYNINKNRLKSLSINNNVDKVLVDGFIYKGKFISVQEKNITSSLNVLKLFDRWQKTIGFINDTKLNNRIVGTSALNIKGLVDNDIYYYPALNGIYSYNLKTNENKHIISLNLGVCEDVQLIKYKDNFILVKENIPLIKFDGETDIDNNKNNDVEIIKYNSDFKIIKKLKLDNNLENITVGSKGFVMTSYICKNGNFKSTYRYINFENLNESVLLEKNNKLNDKNIVDLSFMERDNYLYKSLFIDNKNDFIFINTPQNKIQKIIKENKII